VQNCLCLKILGTIDLLSFKVENGVLEVLFCAGDLFEATGG